MEYTGKGAGDVAKLVTHHMSIPSSCTSHWMLRLLHVDDLLTQVTFWYQLLCGDLRNHSGILLYLSRTIGKGCTLFSTVLLKVVSSSYAVYTERLSLQLLGTGRWFCLCLVVVLSIHILVEPVVNFKTWSMYKMKTIVMLMLSLIDLRWCSFWQNMG